MKKLVAIWSATINGATRALGILGGIWLCALVLLSTTDVLLRTLFNSPILGTVEITELSMVFIAVAFIAYTQKMKGHIAVEIFTERMSKTWQAVISFIGNLLELCLSFLILWRTLAYIIRIWGRGRTSMILHVPSEIPLICICIGFLFYFLITIDSMLNTVGLIKPEETNNG